MIVIMFVLFDFNDGQITTLQSDQKIEERGQLSIRQFWWGQDCLGIYFFNGGLAAIRTRDLLRVKQAL